ncbi:MAG: GGDEF domain-containing protein [Dehalococcoidia bacterium]|nr:GGDEF domain-containing protein [Dehalococcoidia bacterium]
MMAGFRRAGTAQGGEQRRLDLQTLILQAGIAAFCVAGVVSGLFDAREPWKTPAVIWLIAWNTFHVVYVWWWRGKHPAVPWIHAITPVGAISCITLVWLAVADPYSPLWAVYLYALVGYSRRFRGRSFLALTAVVMLNVALGGMYMSHQRGGTLLDANLVISVVMTGFMATLANAVGDAWRDSERTARTLANTDPLTGIANRRTFLDELDELAEGADRGFSVLMLDLDNFKALNDQHGHLHGDHVLAQAARTMSANLRPGDNIARYGGEEFIVMLPGTGNEEASRIGERLRIAVERETPTSVSVGCATRRPGERAKDVVRRADELLLAAKRRGKNIVVCQSPPMAA